MKTVAVVLGVLLLAVLFLCAGCMYKGLVVYQAPDSQPLNVLGGTGNIAASHVIPGSLDATGDAGELVAPNGAKTPGALIVQNGNVITSDRDYAADLMSIAGKNNAGQGGGGAATDGTASGGGEGQATSVDDADSLEAEIPINVTPGSGSSLGVGGVAPDGE